MAKKKTKKNIEKNKIIKKKQRLPLYEKLNLKQETMHIIYSAFFLLFSIFFIMAAFDKAGKVGKASFSNLSEYLGVGYYVIPAILLIIAYTFFKGLKQDFTKVKVFGAGLFTISALGLIGLIPNKAGSVGDFVASISEYLGP
jgi:uncharacterized membrane protein (DUF485 family)